MDLRLFAEPQQGATYDHQLAVARLGESLGFDAFFRSDHYQRIGAGDPGPGPTDSWVTLAGLARETSTIRLGTMVTSATFRHPGPLAVAVAEVDAMSDGRVELGIGAGWYEDEHRAYGIPFPDVVERFDRLEEQLAVITGLWTTPTGERFSFDGHHYPVVDSPALPKPRQQPRPPIIIGGRGTRRTPALAARYADEFNVIFPGRVHRFVAGRDVVARACEALGRDPASMRWSAPLVLCCGTDAADFERRAAAAGRDPAQLRGREAAGTSAEVVELLAGFRDAGADRIYLQLPDLTDLDHIRLVAEEVMPHVR
ncbi:MAG TPA: LLM class F420-dependent oxidoreductase [Acidimicrobiales bacterium]|jgi:F420-dependent oxidoreductase-like protein